MATKITYLKFFLSFDEQNFLKRKIKKIQLLLGQDLQQFYQIWLVLQLQSIMENSMYQFLFQIN